MTVDLEALKALQQEDEARRAVQALAAKAKMRADFVVVLTVLGTWRGMKNWALRHPVYALLALFAAYIVVIGTNGAGFFLLGAVWASAKLASRYFV